MEKPQEHCVKWLNVVKSQERKAKKKIYFFSSYNLFVIGVKYLWPYWHLWSDFTAHHSIWKRNERCWGSKNIFYMCAPPHTQLARRHLLFIHVNLASRSSLLLRCLNFESYKAFYKWWRGERCEQDIVVEYKNQFLVWNFVVLCLYILDSILYTHSQWLWCRIFLLILAQH